MKLLKSKLFVNIYEVIISSLLTIYFISNFSIEKDYLILFSITFAALFSAIWFSLSSIMLTLKLQKILNLKYKIIENFGKYTNHLKVKYLTSWFLFIPYWKSIKKERHETETINIFGIKEDDVFYSEKKYYHIQEAKNEIEKHKKEIKNNLNEYLKPHKLFTKNKKVYYYN